VADIGIVVNDQDARRLVASRVVSTEERVGSIVFALRDGDDAGSSPSAWRPLLVSGAMVEVLNPTYSQRDDQRADLLNR
jgi:hypothetical protein